MARRVVITGLGPVSGLGIGIESTWQALAGGTSSLGPIAAFDASGFPCRIAGQVQNFKVNDFVPKTYRKATKVMARDIELAVAAADQAARDAKLVTKGTAAAPDAAGSYPSPRMGCHIGAGLIAAELDELTDALAQARNDQGSFDMHKWGSQGMTHLTPLWLLKYLPNMLACHVTIIHDAQGPSNTITCGEASSGLSIGESLRVIQRDAADLCFCGGADSKLNPMAFLRQVIAKRLNEHDNDRPTQAVRPFCQTAAGTVLGEGGGIVVLEAKDTFDARAARDGARAYAELVGFGASQSVNRASRSLWPDAQGRGLAIAIRSALREAAISADQIDLIVPMGLGIPACDQAEAAALQSIFGQSLTRIPLASVKPYAGNCGAGAGALDVCAAARAVLEQTIPATLNCQNPLPGLQAAAAPARKANLRYVLTYSAAFGGQNAALVLKRVE